MTFIVKTRTTFTMKYALINRIRRVYLQIVRLEMNIQNKMYCKAQQSRGHLTLMLNFQRVIVIQN